MTAQQTTIEGLELIAPKQMTPARLLEMAVEKGDIEMIAKAMDLQINWEKHEAKRQFDSSLEVFRHNKVVIEKTKNVRFANKDGSETSYWHAELDKASEVVEEALHAVGLVHTWKPGVGPEGKPKMILVLRGHGHTEEMGEMVGPPDLSGGKNAMQAIGSSTSYLARYVLLFSLGIIPKGIDDDGRSATGGLPEKTILEYCTAITDASNFEEAKKHFTECWNKAGDCSDEGSQMRFLKVFNEKKKKLAEAKHGR